MRRNQLAVLFVALVLATSGAAGAITFHPQSQPSVNLSAGTNEPVDDAPSTVDDETSESTTTTTTTVVESHTTTTTTTAAPTTTTTIDSTHAVVAVTNHTNQTAHAWVGDDSEHEADLAPGASLEWHVTTSLTHPDSGGVALPGSQCGGRYSDQDLFKGGHHYTFDIAATPSGFCPMGEPMPKVTLIDTGTGSSHTLAGAVPDARHTMLYVVNRYKRSSVDISVNDDTTHNWSLGPNQWGAAMMQTSNEHGDGAGVTRPDLQCGYGDGDETFEGGHTYRLEAIAGQPRCSDTSTPTPILHVFDLTAGTSMYVSPGGLPGSDLPTTG